MGVQGRCVCAFCIRVQLRAQFHALWTAHPPCKAQLRFLSLQMIIKLRLHAKGLDTNHLWSASSQTNV